MAVGFTGMMPLFQKRSADLIKEKLADIYGESFPRIIYGRLGSAQAPG